MGDKKLWNRADVRAEMNRLVKGTADACKIIHAANAAIEALGKETGFEDDATRAWAELRRCVFPGVKETKPTGTWLVEHGPTRLPALPGKMIPRIENTEALRDALGRPVYTPAGVQPTKSEVQRVLETWGAQGCTCGLQKFPVTGSDIHSHICNVTSIQKGHQHDA